MLLLINFKSCQDLIGTSVVNDLFLKQLMFFHCKKQLKLGKTAKTHILYFKISEKTAKTANLTTMYFITFKKFKI